MATLLETASQLAGGVKSASSAVVDTGKKVVDTAIDSGKTIGSVAVDAGKAVGGLAADNADLLAAPLVGGVTAATGIIGDTVDKLTGSGSSSALDTSLSDAEKAFGTQDDTPTKTIADRPASEVVRSRQTVAVPIQTAEKAPDAEVVRSQQTVAAPIQTMEDRPSDKGVKSLNATFTNPLTGEIEEFDSIDKMLKRKKQVAEQAIDQGKEKELQDISDDFLASSATFIQDVMNPETPDPIKVAQINEMVAKFGPENQAAMDSMLLALKQDGLAGSGAGNAMLLLMARGNKAQFSEMTQKLNTQSAQRISDMNKYGAELGLRIRSQVNSEVQQRFQNNASLFNTAVASGDFSSARNLAADLGIPNLDMSKLEAMSGLELAAITDQYFQNAGFSSELADTMTGLTGIAFNASQYTSLDPARQAIISDRLAAIEKLPNSEAKREALLQLAEEYPEAFGFPGDPEKAKEMIADVDLENTAATAAAIESANNFWLTESVVDSPNIEGIIAAGDGYWSSSTDVQIDNLFNNQSGLFNILNAESQANIMGGMVKFGVQSLTDIDTREEKEAFLSLSKFEEQRENVGTTATEIFGMFKTNFAGTELESWFDESDPEKSNVARMWIAENIIAPGDFEIDPETGQVILDPTKISPPWSAESAQYEFYTWPRKTWNEAGEVVGTTYSGEEFRSDLGDDSVFNDPTEIVEDQRLTNAYKTYKKNDDTGLNWLEWYDVTQGGTKKIDRDFSSGDSNLDFADESLSLFDTAISTGDFTTMSDDQILNALAIDDSALTRMINSENIKNLSTSDILSNDIIRVSDFLELGLRADVEVSGKKSGSGLEFGEDTGVGTGNGSVIVINGRPARVVEFASSAGTSSNPLKTGIARRMGNLWVEYLDEPIPREKEKVGGSEDFVSV